MVAFAESATPDFMSTPLSPALPPLPDGESEPTLVLGEAKPSFAWLVMLHGPRRGRLYHLRAEGTSLGRGATNDIIVDDEAVSRFHSRLFAEPVFDKFQFYVQDLASANGTFVNGLRVVRQVLHDEDRIVVGQATLVFKQL